MITLKVGKGQGVYVVRAYFATSGRIEHMTRPTLKDARRSVRVYMEHTKATTVTILRTISITRRN